MSKAIKTWLIIAAALVVIGVMLFAAAMLANHWDFSLLSTDRFETNSYEITEQFSSINMNIETADVVFAVSDDDMCRVVCVEQNNMKHSVSVQDDTLFVKTVDVREWHDYIGINLRSPKVTVYLPKTEFASILIQCSTGNITIPNEIKVDIAEISLNTGDIRVNNMSTGTLALSSSTGEMILCDVACTGDITANTTIGDVKLENVTCRNLLSKGSTSDISLKNVIAAEKISVKRSTGDVVFDGSDAAEIFVETSTGDVVGSLLTEKVFVTETSTGDIRVPKTTTGGICEVKTSTGDILFR